MQRFWTEMSAITPLDAWIREKTRIGYDDVTGESAPEHLKNYQLRKINEIIDYARRKTDFYGTHYGSLPDRPLSKLSDLTGIPFTEPSDISENPNHFLAVRQDDIARVVTLRTSGSTGESKRLFFTEDDLELTIDFFHHGMSTLVRPGWRVAILLPGELPDSVGDLLMRGLKRMDVQSLIYGPVKDPFDAARAIISFGAQCVVGIPTQVLGVARSYEGNAIGCGILKSVLLSTDYVPRAIVRSLENVWDCKVFNHYGMTETGLGGGVECEALNGYHLREADLYFEIVDHETGEPCPDGVLGEVVFTTLTRRGMPLIRYRTGDIARIIPEPCPCGSFLRRMAPVRGRWGGGIHLGPDSVLTLPDIDEVLFALPDLLDYRATVSKVAEGRWRLHINVHRVDGGKLSAGEVMEVLNQLRAVREGVEYGHLEVPVVEFSPEGRWVTTGTSKRKIIVLKDSDLS